MVRVYGSYLDFRNITFEAANVCSFEATSTWAPETSLKNQSEMSLNHLPPITMVQWKEIRLGAGTFLTEPWHYGSISPDPTWAKPLVRHVRRELSSGPLGATCRTTGPFQWKVDIGQNPQDLAPNLVPRKIQDFNKQIIPNNGYPQIQDFLNTNLEANQVFHLQAKLEVSGLAASEMKVPLRASENPRGV